MDEASSRRELRHKSDSWYYCSVAASNVGVVRERPLHQENGIIANHLRGYNSSGKISMVPLFLLLCRRP